MEPCPHPRSVLWRRWDAFLFPARRLAHVAEVGHPPRVCRRRLEACTARAFHPFRESRRLMGNCFEKFFVGVALRTVRMLNFS